MGEEAGAIITAGSRGRLFALTIVLCALGFAVVEAIPRLHHEVFSTNDYLIFHTVAELLSVIVSFAIFTVGWHGYRQNANRQNLFIGVVFLMVGLIDFLHTLSYNGMPEFLSPNSVSKASTYWIAARLTNSIGLLAAAFILPASRSRWLRPWTVLGAGLGLVAALTIAVSYFPDRLPPMFIPAVGQTAIKKALEWMVIAFSAGAIYVFGRRGKGEHNVILLQMALIMVIFSEFSLTLYTSAFDVFNALGHAYKVAATYLIFRALFLSSFQQPYYELMKARDQIEQSFAKIGLALASSLELNETLELIAQLASDMLRSRYAAVMLIRDGDLRIQAGRGIASDRSVISTERTSAGMALMTRKPVVIADVNAMEDHRADGHCRQLDGPPARSVVSAPIMAGEDVLGVVEVYSPEVDAFGLKEAGLLSSFARQAAVAIRNSIAYEQKYQVAETLQRSLLPAAPTIPGLDIAVRYVPAEDVAKVGGDLYGVFALDDDRLAIIIGDVCGHGLEAASLTAMTLYTIKSLLVHGMPPNEALTNANTTLLRSTEGNREMRFVTCFVCVLDLRTRRLEYANAGHHMPLIFREGECKLMELQSDLPLLIGESTDYRAGTADLRDAQGLLLYTDGVIEARRQGELFGEDNLCRLCVETMGESANEMLDVVVEETRNWAGLLQDDVALLAVKWKGNE